MLRVALVGTTAYWASVSFRSSTMELNTTPVPRPIRTMARLGVPMRLTKVHIIKEMYPIEFTSKSQSLPTDGVVVHGKWGDCYGAGCGLEGKPCQGYVGKCIRKNYDVDAITDR